MNKIIRYDFKLIRGNGKYTFGRTDNLKYIDNLIKYKGRIEKKKNKLSVIKVELVYENSKFKTINEEVVFNNID